jgi:Disulphide bond corrector protein DsbC
MRLPAVVIAIGVSVAAAQAQIVPTGPQNRPAIAKTDAVKFLFPEQVTVQAGKLSQVELHFRVADGLHINSHTPSTDDLIATDFSIPDGAGVRLESAAYPEGKIISLPFDPTTKLSVYTGEFIVNARVVAEPGNHLMKSKLHYQACDRSQCLPPKTIDVPIDVIGK